MSAENKLLFGHKFASTEFGGDRPDWQSEKYFRLKNFQVHKNNLRKPRWWSPLKWQSKEDIIRISAVNPFYLVSIGYIGQLRVGNTDLLISDFDPTGLGKANFKVLLQI